MCKGVHGMRVHLTRLVLHLASACLYHICFTLMVFLMFFVLICVFWVATKTQGRACAESNLYPFCCGNAEILKSSCSIIWTGSFIPSRLVDRSQ